MRTDTQQREMRHDRPGAVKDWFLSRPAGLRRALSAFGKSPVLVLANELGVHPLRRVQLISLNASFGLYHEKLAK